MPDQRKHRGPHPEDGPLFAPANWPDLRCAVSHLSWLLTRAYAWESALKLVGDRFRLTARSGWPCNVRHVPTNRCSGGLGRVFRCRPSPGGV